MIYSQPGLRGRSASVDASAPEVSFVIPCLNEEASVANVVRRALESLDALGVSGEVVVADNGSTDASAIRAAEAGATVIHEPRRGYGSAYLAGLAAARGRYVVMADADDSYDFSTLGEFLERLRDGADVVLGSRMKGRILPGAMPWTHRWIGNPLLTRMLNLLFGAGVSDAHCGLRAVRRDAVPKLALRATGMEFASEMVIKAAKRRLTIAEVPIAYHPRVGESKLSAGRDAWRHVRFMLVHSATFLFVVPGTVSLAVGLGTLTPLALDRHLGAPSWTIPVAIGASFLAVVGAQVIQLGLFARTYAAVYLEESVPFLEHLWRRFRLEHGLLLGAGGAVIGIAVALTAAFDSVPDPALGLLGLTLLALGLQGIFGAFFLSILGLSEHAIVKRRGA